MHNLTHAQELDGFAHIRVLHQAQNIVVGGTGLLLCRHILHQIRNGVPCHLKLRSSERESGSRLGPHANGMIYIIIRKAALFNLFHGQVPGQLMHDGRHDFQVGQLFRTH